MPRTPHRTGLKPAKGSRFPSRVFGDNLRDFRGIRRLSQEDVAARLTELGHAWKRTTVSEVERGRRSVSIDELFGLAIVLQVTIVRLLDPRGLYGMGETPVDLGLPNAETVHPELAVSLVEGGSRDPNQPGVVVAWRDNKAVKRTLVQTSELSEWMRLEDNEIARLTEQSDDEEPRSPAE